MSENKEKLVVVTGGTKGIGRALVEKFSAEQFTVATCSRNEVELKELKAYIKETYGSKLLIQVADMSLKKGVSDFIEQIQMTGKPVEVLINNAGYFVPGEIHLEAEGVLEKQIETNLYSAYRMSRGLIPGMKKQGSGHIFNVCSVASIMAYPNGGSYSISKFALYGMSKTLREELKHDGIKVTSVLPGATLTASWAGVELPEERFMKSEDVADIVWATYQLSERTVVEDILLRPQLGDL